MHQIPKYDIVYVLKENVSSEELKYSLRSVVENMNYNRIVFYGGTPKGVEPDLMIPHTQSGDTKLQRAKSTWKIVMADDRLTDNIWWFNDDFFLLKPFCFDRPFCNGTLRSVIKDIEDSRNGMSSKYTRYLATTESALMERGLDTISYETHTPFLVNREKARVVYEKFPSDVVFRSAYGNFYKLDGYLTEDVKISNLNDIPADSAVMVSTNNKSFKYGRVGAFLQQRFPTRCKYEL